MNDFENLGYLVWMTIPYHYLEDPRLGELLERDLGGEGDEYLRKLHQVKARVWDTALALRLRRVVRVRTGLSWAEWEAPFGRVWIKWYMSRLARHFRVMPNLTFTPPDFAMEGRVNAPPKELIAYAEFVHAVAINEKELVDGGYPFEEYELVNEWDLVTDWDRSLDPEYRLLMIMTTMGAIVARHHGKRTVLGGMSGVKPDTLEQLKSFSRSGMMMYFDAVGFHNLRGTWSDRVPPPPLPVQATDVWRAASLMHDRDAYGSLVEDILGLIRRGSAVSYIIRTGLRRPRQDDLSVYVTEYGFPTGDPTDEYSQTLLEDIQVALFASAAELVAHGRIERLYWYTHRDLVGPSLRFVTTGWEDVLQHSYGDTREDGVPKLLGRLLDEAGPVAVMKYAEKNRLGGLVHRASLERSLPKGYRSQSSSK